MKNLTLALAAAATFMALGASPVHAGATCKLVPTLCPPPPGGGGASDVPEPATFAVLALGACAAGLAARRRKK